MKERDNEGTPKKSQEKLFQLKLCTGETVLQEEHKIDKDYVMILKHGDSYNYAQNYTEVISI